MFFLFACDSELHQSGTPLLHPRIVGSATFSLKAGDIRLRQDKILPRMVKMLWLVIKIYSGNEWDFYFRLCWTVRTLVCLLKDSEWDILWLVDDLWTGRPSLTFCLETKQLRGESIRWETACVRVWVWVWVCDCDCERERVCMCVCLCSCERERVCVCVGGALTAVNITHWMKTFRSTHTHTHLHTCCMLCLCSLTWKHLETSGNIWSVSTRGSEV